MLLFYGHMVIMLIHCEHSRAKMGIMPVLGDRRHMNYIYIVASHLRRGSVVTVAVGQINTLIPYKST